MMQVGQNGKNVYTVDEIIECIQPQLDVASEKIIASMERERTTGFVVGLAWGFLLTFAFMSYVIFLITT